MSLRDSLKSDLKNVLLNKTDFGEDAIYTAKGSATSKTVTGIFREKSHEDRPLSHGISSTQPTFQCSKEDIATTRQGDTLTISRLNKSFYVLNSTIKTNGTILIFLSDDPV